MTDDLDADLARLRERGAIAWAGVTADDIQAIRAGDMERIAALAQSGVAGPPGSLGVDRLLDGYAGCVAFDEWRGF